MTRNRNAEIRDRLARRLKALGKEEDYAWLAEQTGETRQQARKWAVGETDTFPATFAAKLESGGVVAAQWLLLEKGSPDVVPPSEAVERLTVIGSIAEGQKVSPATLREIQKLIDGPADWVAGGIVEERPEPNSEEE